MSLAILDAPEPRSSYIGRIGSPSQLKPDGSIEAKVRSVHDAVEAVYDLEKGMLGHPTRGRSRIAFARQVAMYLAHVTFGLTLTTVGHAFGRDRTTVSHACALVEDARDNPEFDRTVELLEAIAKRLASLEGEPSGLLAE